MLHLRVTRAFPSSMLESVPRWEPIHPDFVQAIRMLDALGLPYAELWRMLRPVARRLDLPRPSYWVVRRIAIQAREEKVERRDYLLDILEDMATGIFPKGLYPA